MIDMIVIRGTRLVKYLETIVEQMAVRVLRLWKRQPAGGGDVTMRVTVETTEGDVGHRHQEVLSTVDTTVEVMIKGRVVVA